METTTEKELNNKSLEEIVELYKDAEYLSLKGYLPDDKPLRKLAKQVFGNDDVLKLMGVSMGVYQFIVRSFSDKHFTIEEFNVLLGN